MRHTRKPTTLPLGMISEGTLRPEDLIPAYLDALEGIRLSRAERATVRQVNRDWQNAECNSDGPGTFADDDLPDLVTDLEEILEAHTPDYAYFGSLEGDGACFGVWPSIEQLEEDSITRDRYLDPHDPRRHTANVIKVDAGELPDLGVTKYGITHVMSVTDHGNVTLYRRAGNRWIDVWSVV